MRQVKLIERKNMPERPDRALELIANKEAERLRARLRQLQTDNLSLHQKFARLELDNRRLRESLEKEAMMHEEQVRRLEDQKLQHLRRQNDEFKSELQILSAQNEDLVYQLQMEKQDILRTLESKGLEGDRLRVQLDSQTALGAQLKQAIFKLQEEMARMRQQNELERSRQGEEAERRERDLRGVISKVEKELEDEKWGRTKDREHFVSELENIRLLQQNQLQEQQKLSQAQLQTKEAELDKLRLVLKERTLSMAQELAEKEEQVQMLSKQLAAGRAERQSLDNLVAKLKAQLGKAENEVSDLLQSNNSIYDKCVEYEELLRRSEAKGRQLQDKEKARAEENLSLRQVLLESSEELQRCKVQIGKADFEIARVAEDGERDRCKFLMIIEEKEIEATRWRESYFSLKAQL